MKEDLQEILNKYDTVPSPEYYEENPELKHWTDLRLEELETYIKDREKKAVEGFANWLDNNVIANNFGGFSIAYQEAMEQQYLKERKL